MSTTNLRTELSRSGDTRRETVSRAFDALANPDLQAVCAVAAIGLLLNVVLARLFPIVTS
jgi:DNA-binding phage protein